jgi:hypothetical protein
MKQSAVVGIGGSWNHQKKGSAHTFDTVDVESRRVVDFEIVQKATESGRGKYQRSSHGIE